MRRSTQIRFAYQSRSEASPPAGVDVCNSASILAVHRSITVTIVGAKAETDRPWPPANRSILKCEYEPHATPLGRIAPGANLLGCTSYLPIITS